MTSRLSMEVCSKSCAWPQKSRLPVKVRMDKISAPRVKSISASTIARLPNRRSAAVSSAARTELMEI